MGLDLSHPHLGVAVPGPAHIAGDEQPQYLALGVAEVRPRNALIADFGVVPERSRSHAAVGGVLQLLGQVVGVDGRAEDRGCHLGVVERAHQIETGPLLRCEHHRSGEWPFVDVARLGAHERGGEHHLVADDGAVEAEVVAVDLPRPRLAAGRVAEDRHEVGPLTELIWAVGHVSQELVETHDVARLGEPPVRQRCPQQVQAKLALVGRQILQHHPVPEDVGVDVEPGAALLGIEGKHGPATPIGVERPEKGARGLGDRRRAHAGGLKRVEALADRAVRGKAGERLGHADGSLVDHGLQRRRELVPSPGGKSGGAVQPKVGPVSHQPLPVRRVTAIIAARWTQGGALDSEGLLDASEGHPVFMGAELVAELRRPGSWPVRPTHPRQLEILEFPAGRRRRGQSPTGGPVPRRERLQDHSASLMCRHRRHRSPNQGETRHWAPSWPARRPPHPIRPADRPVRTEECPRTCSARPIRLPRPPAR
jgi:hypothetical protein